MADIRDRIVGLERVKASTLQPNARNWRRHPDQQREALRGVLAEIGFAGAVLVRRTDEGALELIDGHLRQEETGDTEIPVLVTDLTAMEADALLAVYDPIAAMAKTDRDALRSLIDDIAAEDEALAKFLDHLKPRGGAGADSALPDLTDAEPVTQPGDLWLLGAHRLMCGDANQRTDLDRLLGNGKIGCVLTDPPYGINLDTDYSQENGSVSGRTYRRVVGDDQAFDATALRARVADAAEQFWFGANYYRRTLTDDDRDGSWLVWDKRTPETDVVLGAGFELIWSATAHKQDLLRYLWTNFTSHDNEGHRREHPTEKPIAMLADILTRWAPEGCIVADFFLGSGTTLIAAEVTGRTCYGLEIDPRYCDLVIARWEAQTGQTATLEEAH